MIKRDKQCHYIMIKGSIHQEDITIVSTYAPNIGAPKHIEHILTELEREISSNTILVGDFNISLSKLDRSSRQRLLRKQQI